MPSGRTFATFSAVVSLMRKHPPYATVSHQENSSAGTENKVASPGGICPGEEIRGGHCHVAADYRFTRARKSRGKPIRQ